MVSAGHIERLAVFTICSNNYTPYAALLMDSVVRHLPAADRFLILADTRHPRVPYPENCEVLEATALNIPDFPTFAFRYDVMELNTAVKPFAFLRLLRDRGYDACLYFDPDIELFGPLTSVIDALASKASFVLTPHLLAPAEQPEPPDDITVMKAGIYNLGFLGVARVPESLELLAWWARRLRWQCVSQQEDGLFVDQKFMDLIPGFARAAKVLHDPGLNVAYWNLAQRRFNPAGSGGPLVDGEPLGFFHYSGFDPRLPDRLSKYTELFRGRAMFALMRNFVADYAARLNAAGQGSIPSGLYAYGRFASGVPVPTLVRRMFRDTNTAWAGNPFDNYEEWLNLPVPGTEVGLGTAVPGSLPIWVRDREPWLRHNFDPATPDGSAGLIRWWLQHSTNLGLDRRLLEPIAAAAGLKPLRMAARRPAPNSERADVTVVGYLRTESGVGEVGRQTLSSLASFVNQVEGLDIGLGVLSRRNDTRIEPWLLSEDRLASGRLLLFNINADQLPSVAGFLRSRLPRNAYRVCIPFWELARFPQAWLPAFDLVDEVWAPTRFVQAALASELDCPVVHVPVALEFPELPAEQERSAVDGLLDENRPYVLFAFDFLSFVERKNPLAAVRAFRNAFDGRRPAARPALVIKTQNATAGDSSALREAIGPDSNVLLFDGTLDRTETLALVAGAACVLSLHRSEGFGLLVAEAMFYGVPVVATDYGGTTDLLTPETGFPVDYRLVPVPESGYPYPEGQVWADADVTHAAWLLQEVFERPEEALRRSANARRRLRERNGVNAVALVQAKRLRTLGLA